MAQSTLNSFFPTVKKTPNLFYSPKPSSKNKAISNCTNDKKTTLLDFFANQTKEKPTIATCAHKQPTVAQDLLNLNQSNEKEHTNNIFKEPGLGNNYLQNNVHEIGNFHRTCEELMFPNFDKKIIEDGAYFLQEESQFSNSDQQMLKQNLPLFQDAPKFLSFDQNMIEESISISPTNEQLIFQKFNQNEARSMFPLLEDQKEQQVIRAPHFDLNMLQDNTNIDSGKMTNQDQRNVFSNENLFPNNNRNTFLPGSWLTCKERDINGFPNENVLPNKDQNWLPKTEAHQFSHQPFLQNNESHLFSIPIRLSTNDTRLNTQNTIKSQNTTRDATKSPFKTNLLIKWLKKDQKNDDSAWASLPKDLVLRVMQFLTMKDNAKLACVNKYYTRCFNSIWFSYDFLAKFNFNTFSTAREINKVFEKSSRMCHIRKMKSILTGKKLDAFIKKTKLSTTLARNMQKKGSLFEEFSIEPRNKGMALFITDKEVEDICESSKYSLMFISLVSCQLITDKSFNSISRCSNLQNLSICRNNFLKDENLMTIIQKCKNLKSLNVSGCHGLTDRAIDDICHKPPKLEVLELADNPQLSMNNFFKLRELSSLRRLNVSSTNVKNEGLRGFLCKKPENLEYLNLDSCRYLDKETIVLLILFRPPRLKYLNMGHNLNFEEKDIWKLVFCIESLVELEVEDHLMGENVKSQLALNRIYDEQKQ